MSAIYTGPKMSICLATEADAAAFAEIYNQGIEDRVATYETELRSPEDRCTWLRSIAGRYPALVAAAEGQVVGWADTGPYLRANAIATSGNSRCMCGASTAADRSAMRCY